MTDCVASNNYKPEYKFKNYELVNIIEKEKIIKNLNISKTRISRANKKELNNIINEYNIDINKYRSHIEFIESINDFIFDGYKYNWGNNIHKPCKHRKLKTILNNNKFCIY
tara:strand:- start:8074 stop:8406 length:333 start_codon:yes stop_codon:yes gene_type:complete